MGKGPEKRQTYLTRHAKRRMRWRNISPKDVEKTLTNPDRVEQLPSGRKNAFKLMGDKLIQVSYIEGGKGTTVITVVDKNR